MGVVKSFPPPAENPEAGTPPQTQHTQFCVLCTGAISGKGGRKNSFCREGISSGDWDNLREQLCSQAVSVPCLCFKADHSQALGVPGLQPLPCPSPSAQVALLAEGMHRDPWLLKHWGHSLGLACAHGLHLLDLRLIALQEDGDSSVASLDSDFILNHWKKTSKFQTSGKFFHDSLGVFCFTLALLSKMFSFNFTVDQSAGSPKSYFN